MHSFYVAHSTFVVIVSSIIPTHSYFLPFSKSIEHPNPKRYYINFSNIFGRYPLQLKVGIHIIKVPVRAKVHASVQCNIKVNAEKIVVFYNFNMVPDLVNGNWFSTLFSIRVSNINFYIYLYG